MCLKWKKLSVNTNLVDSTLDRSFLPIENEARIDERPNTKQRKRRPRGNPYRFIAQQII